MSYGKRYDAMLAGQSLRKKLSRINPTAFIYCGTTIEPPYQVLVHANQELADVPDTYTHQDITYDVVFYMRDNGRHKECQFKGDGT